MKKVLITGGPVHAHLDAVKIITNRFKGGLMVDLAQHLKALGADVTYLYAPKAGALSPGAGIATVEHQGFDDYRKKVLALAPQMDGVVLGAAVANLIPVKPWKGKFPSHDYKPGDEIPIPFMIAPRIIDGVKAVAPKAHLFGFKLLEGVPHEDLICAAYGIVLEAKATAVIANDATNLQTVFPVTKERGVHPMARDNLASWIREMLYDEYYSSQSYGSVEAPPQAVSRVKELIDAHKHRFTHTESGLIFGTVAVRADYGFVTTGRGKRELDSIAYVLSVDHSKRHVHVAGGAKASLNAPLLATMFANQNVAEIVHFHEQVPGLPTYTYAPPGSWRDTLRPNHTSFNIKEHGCMLLFDAHGRQL